MVIVIATALPTAVVASEHSMKLRLVCVTGFQCMSNTFTAAHAGVLSDPVSQCVHVPAAAHVAAVAAVVAVPVVQQMWFVAAVSVPSISPSRKTAWVTPPSMLAAVIAEHVFAPAKRKRAMLTDFIVRVGGGKESLEEMNSVK